jgi:hypothetical protein
MLPVKGGFPGQLRLLGEALVVDGRLDRDLESKIVPVDGGVRLGDRLLKRKELSRPAPAPSQFNDLIGELAAYKRHHHS